MTASDWGPDSPADDARDAAELPPSSSMAARTPVPEGDGTPEGRTDDLRADLARRLARSEGWSQPTHMHRVQADELISQGWRLVSEDEATVELLAVAMHTAGCGCGMTLDEHQASMRHDFDEEDPAYADMARAAVRALRNGGGDE